MESTKVFVVDAEEKPLLPTHPAKARKLLREGKAQVFRVVPFTIQLQKVVANPTGEFSVGVDDGAKEVGIAIVNPHKGEVVFTGVISLREDVSRKITQRRMYRSARRYRNVRHRKARFYRSKKSNWLTPTIRQKKDSTLRVIRDLQSVMNITHAMVEQGAFDLSARKSLPGNDLYQIPQYEGQNFRAKVLWRDQYHCQNCGSQRRLQAHHIIFKSHGGSDTPENGITLCVDCHSALHRNEWMLTQKPKLFIYPAHLQIGKHYLTQQLEKLGIHVQTCAGWMTYYWRKHLRLEKNHINDAVSMICQDYIPRFVSSNYSIIPKRKKVWENNPTKTCMEKDGLRHWDLVKATHKKYGVVIGSIRSLKANAITLRTTWDNNFPVSYSKTKLLWRFNNIVYVW